MSSSQEPHVPSPNVQGLKIAALDFHVKPQSSAAVVVPRSAGKPELQLSR